MFRASLFLSLVSFAFALSGVGDLKVSVSPVASSVSSIEDIILTATVWNPTSADVSVFTSDSNVLDSDYPTQSFRVSKDGEEVAFTGAISSDFAGVRWVTLAAGESIVLNHTVSNYYDFEAHGTGIYTFSPIASFRGYSTNAVVDAEPVTVEVTDDVLFRICCDCPPNLCEET